MWSGFDSSHGTAVGTPTTCDVDNPPLECYYNDGLSGSSSYVLYAVGGYFTDTAPGANLSILIEGTIHNIGKLTLEEPGFVGIIDTNGFMNFEFREVDGKIGQGFPVFADDFILATLETIPANNSPTFTQIPDLTIDEMEYTTILLTASDLDDGDSLRFSLASTLPMGAHFYNNYDGTAGFNWRPNLTQSGKYSFNFIVSDRGFPSLSDTLQLTITVNDLPNNDLIFKNSFE